MFSVDEYRARYASASSDELLSLLAIDPQRLTAEARLALAEETARRGIDPMHPRGESVVVQPERTGQFIYPKAPLGERLGAYVVDGIIGMGPAIMAAIFNYLFPIVVQSPTTRTINMIATFAWAIYYGFTKDARPNGQSIGKKIFGLMVVSVKTDRPCSLGQSIGRAVVPALLDMIPLIGWLVEPIVVIASHDGRRIGDDAAGTQVIRASLYEEMNAVDAGAP